ncbi:GPROR8.2 family protein [Megaselia abdita]
MKMKMRTKLIQLENFMKISKFFFKGLGMVAYRDVTVAATVAATTTLFMNIVFWSNFVNLNVTIVLELIYLVKAMSSFSSFLEATALAPCIGFCILSEFKLFTVWRSSNQIIALVNGLKEFFPQSVEQQEKFMVEHWLKRTLRLGVMYSSCLIIAIWAFNLLPLFWSLVEFYVAGGQFNWRFAYLLWYPFQVNTIPVYSFIYTHQVFAGYTAAGGFFCCDIFMFNLILLLCMNFSYIANSIAEMKPCGTEKDSMQLNALVKHHQRILELSNITSEIFSVTILVNFVSSVFIICLTSFQVTAEVPPMDFIKYLLFLLHELSQIGTICYLGDYLITSSRKVGYSAFNQEWWNGSLSYQKSILLVISRAQKPSFLIAKGFAIVSMECFTDILTKSYQFFVCLRHMYGD